MNVLFERTGCEYDEGNLRDHSRLVGEKFVESFSKAGFEYHKPAEITSDIDSSVRFIGSITNLFKKRILGLDLPESGYFTIQPCLRTHNQKSFEEPDSPIKWGSFFTMLGSAAPSSTYEHSCATAWQYFTEGLNIDQKNIVVQVSADDEDLQKFWKLNSNVEMEVGKQDSKYYRWKYGNQDMFGRGITIGVNSQRDEAYKEVGNIIKIEKAGKEIAVESGFGVEAIIARIFGLSHTLMSSGIAKAFDLRAQDNSDMSRYKLADALFGTCIIIKNGVKPGSRDRARILRNYIKAVCLYACRLNLTLRDIILITKKMEVELPKNTKNSSDEVSKLLLVYLQQVNEKYNIGLKNG